ncbi:MAG TPA: DoxX family protein [Hyphomicrobiaceae bacterium]|nr:DoxX family protein [Hyphomicrobiaceae bacterium]
MSSHSILQSRLAGAQLALTLRIGLGLVFVIGGWAKLERLLTPSRAKGIVDEYVGPLGYINQTFLDWLFQSPLGVVATPWNFLTLLSAFELVSGIVLIAGLMVRPLAVFWALLLWSFVFSLPVVTTPGVKPPAATYMSPAEFVQIRDIALSGFFFVLYNLGPGARSVDHDVFAVPAERPHDWEALGLLLRLSLGVVFLVGGLFAGYNKITTFGMPGLLLTLIGAGLVAGLWTRTFGAAAAALLVYFMVSKLAGASGIVGYLNSVKREFALLAGAGVLALAGGGSRFAATRAIQSFNEWTHIYVGGQRVSEAIPARQK